MNPLGNGYTGGNLPPQLKQNIQQVKQMMNMFNGNPNTLIQQNPMLNEIMQTYKGQSPQQIFMELARQRGIDPNAIINELRK